jgi:O-antigen/teichoic acid export membrane protein
MTARGTQTRAAAAAIAGQFAARGITFLLVLVAARVLPREDYGALNLMLLLQVLCLALSVFGLDVLLMRDLTAGKPGAGALRRKVLSVKRVVGGCAVGVTTAYLMVSLSQEYWLAGGLLIGSAYWASLAETHETMLAHGARYGLRSLVQVGPYAVMGVAATLILRSELSATWMIGLVALTFLVREVSREHLASRAAVPVVANAPREDARMAPSSGLLLRRSAPFAAIAALGYLYTRVDSLIVSGFLGTSKLGSYSAAYNLYTGLILIVSALGPLLMQRAGEAVVGERSPVPELVSFGLFGLAVGVVSVLLADGVVKLAYNDTYAESASLLQILACGLPFNYANSVALRHCYMLGLELRIPRILGVALVVAISGNLVAVPSMGLVGAAWMTVVTEAVFFLGLGYLLLKQARSPIGYVPATDVGL